MLVALRMAQIAADFRPRASRHDEALPERRRRLLLRADDLDLIAILQRRVQRRMDAVDLGADRGVADIGVDEIGEIDRRGAARQRDQHALGREAEHLVLIEGELGVLVELLRALAALQQIHHVAQPFIGFDRARIVVVHAFAIAPMRGDAALGDVVHRLGAELHLDALVLRSHHRGVDRAIAVRLGERDEVLEAFRDHPPGAMQDAQRAVAVLIRADDGAETEHVGELLEVDLLVLELAPDRERAVSRGPGSTPRCRLRRACA